MNKNLKKIAIVVVVLAAGYFIYTTFLSGNSSNSGLPTGVSSTGGSLSSTAISNGGTVPMVGVDEFSTMLSRINSISIDTSIFQDPGYRALRDYPVMLGTDIVGRINPFAPIGTDSSSSLPQGISVQTLTPGKVTSMTVEFGASVSIPTGGAPASVIFQYDTTDTFKFATSPLTVSKSETVLIPVQGLLPSTRYFVRAVAVQGSNTATGNVMTFTTPAN